MLTVLRSFCKGIKPLLIIYLVLQTMLRAGLTFYDIQNIEALEPLLFFKMFSIGIFYDLAAFCYFLIPISIYLTFPAFKHSRSQTIADIIFLTIFTSVLLTTTIAESLFWEEFNARFNFIAVDYLVYTHEVIGNIKESYPVKTLFSIIGVTALLLSMLLIKLGVKLKTRPVVHSSTLKQRFAVLALALLIPTSSFFVINGSIADTLGNRYLNELAKNGYYTLFSAFRNNELNYEKFYLTENEEQALAQLRKNIEDNDSGYLSKTNLYRHIAGVHNPKKYNVIIIIVESLSANFFKTYGNQENITPKLDQILEQSISFSNMRAIGSRTVYGLAAINLSIPPIPGNSIVKRPGNERLFSLAHVFNNKGYSSKFLYGGFGYFDNMNYFFSNNGYEVIDRASLDKAEISFANIWGICDEDLFMRAVKEADKTYSSDSPFFQVIMTTSNHRPYTYPDNKIDIPSHTGRSGSVKYTDYAIDAFINEAKKHEWFNDTIFVITADHTASSAGKIELSPEKYHIPFIIYAPEIIKTPRVIDTLASQIDIGPTILGLLGFAYDSKFFGQDLFKESIERAFISNFQKLGYLTTDGLTILKPIKEASFYSIEENTFTKQPELNKEHLFDAISYFQNAAKWKELNKE